MWSGSELAGAEVLEQLGPLCSLFRSLRFAILVGLIEQSQDALGRDRLALLSEFQRGGKERLGIPILAIDSQQISWLDLVALGGIQLLGVDDGLNHEVEVLLGLAVVSRGLVELIADERLREVVAKYADSPESDHAGGSQHQSDDGPSPPTRITEELDQRAGTFGCLALGNGFLPDLGLAEFSGYDHGQQRRHHAHAEHPSPLAGDHAPRP